MQFTPKDFYKKLLGRVGEDKAARFLRKRGCKILAKNYKNDIGEIDIVAKDGEVVAFVEVKTRTSDIYGEPSEAVTRNKRRKYALVATEYLVRNNLNDAPCRFDVVEIKNDEINYIKDAFTL